MQSLLTCLLVSTSLLSFSRPISLDSAKVKNSVMEFNGGKYNGYLIELNAPPGSLPFRLRQRSKHQSTGRLILQQDKIKTVVYAGPSKTNIAMLAEADVPG